jgi:hypothetical protein
MLNDMLAEIQKQREELIRLQRGVPDISGSARSKRRQVSATVDASGALVDLKFHGVAYRSLAPTELANIIVETIRNARTEAQRQLWDVVGESFPGGTGIADLISGDYDWTESLSLPKPLLDLLQAGPRSRRPPAGPPPGTGAAQNGATSGADDTTPENHDNGKSGTTR